jgi:hypothetical protein
MPMSRNCSRGRRSGCSFAHARLREAVEDGQQHGARSQGTTISALSGSTATMMPERADHSPTPSTSVAFLPRAGQQVQAATAHCPVAARATAAAAGAGDGRHQNSAQQRGQQREHEGQDGRVHSSSASGA